MRHELSDNYQWLDKAEKLPASLQRGVDAARRTFEAQMLYGLAIGRHRSKWHLVYHSPKAGIGVLLAKGTPREIAAAVFNFAAGGMSFKRWTAAKAKRKAGKQRAASKRKTKTSTVRKSGLLL